MEAVLTDGLVVYGQRVIFDQLEQSVLNGPLQQWHFSVAGQQLAWRPVQTVPALPLAPLRERARIAYQVAQAQEAHLAAQRQAEELERQASELRRLLRTCIGVEIKEDAFCHCEIWAPNEDGTNAPMTSSATDAMDAMNVTNAAHVRHATNHRVFVQALTEGLVFRLAPYHCRGSILQVGLSCPDCGDKRWETVDDLIGLGRALSGAETPEAICPNCRNLADFGRDPFADE